MNATNWNQPDAGGRLWMRKLLALCMAFVAACAFAQAPAGGGAPPPLTAAQLDQLVAPIALYPDDLVALILPASTYPLEIVQADRFLDKRKTDKSLKLNDAWQDSVKSLLNYPDVVKKMSTEIDWTADLGEAVVADQNGVIEAIQRFRRQVQSVGNLKSDDKQTVVVEKEVIKVVQANPEVIYVPQYNPSTIVVSGGYTSYGYYPSPYPVYYYPYPPGAAFATGLIWGAAIGAAWNGGHWDCHYGGGGNNNINVNRNTNISTGNINKGNISRGNGQTTAWKSDKKPGQVSSGAGRSPGSANRVGDANRGQGLGDRQGSAGDRQGAGNRQGAGDRQGAGGRDSNFASSRPSAGTSDRGSSYGDRGGQGRGGDAFGGYGGGGNTRADSSRGASSRNTMSSSGRSPSSFQGGGGGGGRASAGGGGGRSGGGGGGGGGRGGRR